MRTLSELFRSRVEAFLERTRMGPTTLGRRAVGDPNFMRELRNGRSPTLATADQVLAFMRAYERARGRGFVPSHPGRRRDPVQRPRGARSRPDPNEQGGERVAGRVLRSAQVEARTGLSRRTIGVRVAEGTFPRPVQLGGDALGWLESDVDGWIRERIAQSRGRTTR